MDTKVTPHVTCLACGNNPTPHGVAKVDSTILLFLNPVMRALLSSVVGAAALYFIRQCFLVLVSIGERVGGMRFVPVTLPLDSMRGQVLAKEALARGYRFEVLMTGTRVHDTYRVTIPGKRPHIFTGVPRVGLVEQVSSAWLDDKWLVKQRLAAAGVPVSRGAVVYRYKTALAAFHQLQKPVIVKPRFGSRGRHSTTMIKDDATLKAAFTSAQQLCWPVIIEEHLYGGVYRATCVDGKLVGVLAGYPPRITGDGVSTISALIEQKNATRPARVAAVTVTDKHRAFLANQGYTETSVLPSGETVDLSEKIGLSYGGSSRELIGETHEKLVAYLERAAKAVNDPIHGFDFITPDVTAHPDTVRWGIIECNSVPFINLHHDPLEGEPVNAAGAVFDYLERHLP